VVARGATFDNLDTSDSHRGTSLTSTAVRSFRLEMDLQASNSLDARKKT
jgi:hypothetical protein